MKRRFFDLSIDVYVPGRWYLAEPRNLDGQRIEDIWQFIDGRRVEDPGSLRIPIFKPGKPIDIEFAGAGQTPIVSARVASVFREMASSDVQLFPVEVEETADPYYLMNVARTVRCIDDSACAEVRLWTPENRQPEKVGQYRVVSGLRIDKSKVSQERVFRLWGWSSPIIIDEELKQALELTGIVGGRFDEV
ncbi:imm11 family protein [Cystobacter fuscus]|uniref:imm11 family protein n=1 Tax=Cystobacter fuscus TaxID=43 RepID=UPI0037BFF766